MRVAVIGNCQARPLAALLQALCPSVSVETVGIVHLLKDTDEPAFAPQLEQADLIIAQQVAANYPCRFVTTERLRASHGAKVCSVVNLYYAGYNPELMYIRRPGQPTLAGPFGEYHSRTVVHAWQNGLSVEEAVRLLHDADWNLRHFASAGAQSLTELRTREAKSDVSICDFIAQEFSEQPLFHTMNHPANALLQEFARRILASQGQACLPAAQLVPVKNEYLGTFRLPVNAGVQKQTALHFKPEMAYAGHAEVPGDVPSYKGRHSYSVAEICAAWFRLYDRHATVVRGVKPLA